MSQRTGDARYLAYMDTAFWDAVDYLRDPDSGLFYRDHRYIPDGNGTELREENGEKVFWSRGIGWVLAAIHACSRGCQKIILVVSVISICLLIWQIK